jgi:hypothetical protein
VCGVDSIERQIQSNALWWGGREVYVAEKYMAELILVPIKHLRSRPELIPELFTN